MASVTDIRDYPAKRIRELEQEKHKYAARVLRSEAALISIAPQDTQAATEVAQRIAAVLSARADEVEAGG